MDLHRGRASILVVLMVIGARSPSAPRRETSEAQEKADELIAALEDAGAPDPRRRTRSCGVLGDDGGAALREPERGAEPGDPARRSSPTAPPGPGCRPVIADSRVVQGQLLIIKVYCPDELEDFQEFVDDLKTDDVAGD